MVLYADKRIITSSEHPNDDWIGNGDWGVRDDSELAQKIKRAYPNFAFVFGADGQPIDVTETEPGPMPPEITTEQRMTAMENAMEEIINMLMEV